MPISTTILATKLFIPPASHRQLARTRLIELLAQGNNYKLTLICAPAGVDCGCQMLGFRVKNA